MTKDTLTFPPPTLQNMYNVFNCYLDKYNTRFDEFRLGTYENIITFGTNTISDANNIVQWIIDNAPVIQHQSLIDIVELIYHPYTGEYSNKITEDNIVNPYTAIIQKVRIIDVDIENIFDVPAPYRRYTIDVEEIRLYL